MFEWHHQVNGHEFEQALGHGEGQGSLAYCSPWGRKKLDTTEPLNNTNCPLTREACKTILLFSHSVVSDSLPSIVLKLKNTFKSAKKKC